MFAETNKATMTACQSDESRSEWHPTLLWRMHFPCNKTKDDFLVETETLTLKAEG